MQQHSYQDYYKSLVFEQGGNQQFMVLDYWN